VAQFYDKLGDVWTIDLDVDLIRKVKRETGVDLAAMFTPAGLQQLSGETLQIFDVVYSLIEAQANARGLNARDFAKRFSGQTIEDCEAALLDAGLDFLPPGRAEPLRRIREKAAEVQTKAAALVNAKIEGLTPEQFLGKVDATTKDLFLKPPPNGGGTLPK
jgi:hypothetical protein